MSSECCSLAAEVRCEWLEENEEMFEIASPILSQIEMSVGADAMKLLVRLWSRSIASESESSGNEKTANVVRDEEMQR